MGKRLKIMILNYKKIKREYLNKRVDLKVINKLQNNLFKINLIISISMGIGPNPLKFFFVKNNL